MTHQTAQTIPQSHITINKGRIKAYNHNVYMSDNQKFEIELFNPLSERILAKIEINCKLIYQGGIILRPGERVYLERYLDENRRFVFKTYNVDSTNTVMIKNNGTIQVLFYKEKQYYNTINVWPNTWYYNTGTSPSPSPYQFNTVYCSNAKAKGIGDQTGIGGNYVFKKAYLSDTGDANNDFNVWNQMEDDIIPLCNNTIKTGMVEKGESSNQALVDSYGTFEDDHFVINEWKILPISNQPKESSDLRRYCTSCGTRLKKTHKFCSNCGTKADD